MGRSRTYHVVGYAPLAPGREAIVGCMSRIEIVQKRHRLAKEGLHVAEWVAQTEVGRKILFGFDVLSDEELAPGLPRLPVCFVCGGHGCICCNYSGYARKSAAKGYQAWQIERIREDVARRLHDRQ